MTISDRFDPFEPINRFFLYMEALASTRLDRDQTHVVSAAEQEGAQELTMTETNEAAESIPTPAEAFVGIPRMDGRMRVTPAIAAAWLKNFNTHNRPFKKKRIESYSRDMTNGRWIYDGAPIRFGVDEDGIERLLDGQNRLAAVVKSGRAQDFNIVTGLPVEAQRVMDQGVLRTVADNLGLEGEKNRMVLASASRIGVLMGLDPTGGAINHGNFVTTTAEQMEWVQDHPDIRAFVDHVAAQKTRWKPFPQGVIAWAMWRLAQVDAVEADRFFTDWREKRTQGRGDPLLTLIDRVDSYKDKNERRMSAAEFLHLIFRTWNARHKGEALRRLQRSSQVPRPVAPRSDG
jgi:hypothetical protein